MLEVARTKAQAEEEALKKQHEERMKTIQEDAGAREANLREQIVTKTAVSLLCNNIDRTKNISLQLMLHFNNASMAFLRSDIHGRTLEAKQSSLL